jgi:hypothetical protein
MSEFINATLGRPFNRLMVRSAYPKELWANVVDMPVQGHFVGILMARISQHIPRSQLLRAIGNKDE